MVSHADQYVWSSHRAYLGVRKQPWITTEFGLALFDRRRARAIRAYASFLGEGSALRGSTSIVGRADEPRVLGNDEFVASLTQRAAVPQSDLTLDEISADVCSQLSVSLNEVRSAAQLRSLCEARGRIASRALELGAARLSDIARYLHRSASSIYRAAAQYGRKER
jgi:putative transposase